MNGLGIYLWSGEWTGQIFIGEYADDQYNGYGIMLLTDDYYEMAYRAAKSLPSKGKLILLHEGCSSEDDCQHISQAIRRRGLRDLYCFPTGQSTLIIRKK